MDTRIDRFITGSYNSLVRGDHASALSYYEELIRQLPDQPIGYIGKAVAVMASPDACSFSQLSAMVLRAKGKVCLPEYEEALHKLLEFPLTDIKGTLLMFCCNGYLYEASRILVELGADVNAVCGADATALWFVCRKALPPADAANGRQIARMLIDRGASVEVTNKGGVALYNSSTDPEIAKMILAAAPHLQKGGAPAGSTSGSQSTGVSVAWILGLTGGAIGLTLGTVLDQFLAGFLWAAVLAACLGFFGAQIDRIRREGTAELGKAIRNMVIAAVILAGFVFVLVGGIQANSPSYGYCPNCGSKMETKYIKNNRCSRCDGNDWYK